LWVNGEHLKRLPLGDLVSLARPFFAKAGIEADDAQLTRAVELSRERAQRLAEMPSLVATAFTEAIDYAPEAVEKVAGREGIQVVLSGLAEALSSVNSWDEDSIKQAIHEAADRMGQKLGALMLPCRVATMGGTSGPDLIPMMAITGKDRVVRRLAAFSASLGA
ncbi:MAG: hypothetical protein KDL87_03210, partial [Verrucomicrobiae bacterium]|nr:hypothetical protein [Verrucomicrobiae bacterium]